MTSHAPSPRPRCSFRPPAPGSSFLSSRGLVGGLAAVALLAAACGSGGDGQGSSAEGRAGGTSATDPLDPLLGDLYQGRTQEEVDMEIETGVQACMTALGWEYTAVARTPVEQGAAGLTAAGAAEADEFAEQYGYGITTDVGVAGETGIGGAGGDDPNAAYVGALPADQQEAYYNDLFGVPGEPDDTGVVTTTGGCYSEASEKVLGPGGFDQLSSQFEEVGKLVEADKRVIDANAAWAACMTGKGYDYATPVDPIDDLSTRYGALGQPPADAELEALQAEELATAKADRACAKEAKLDEANLQAYTDAAAQVAGR